MNPGKPGEIKTILLFSRRTVVEQALRNRRSSRLRRLFRAGHPAVRSLRRAHEEHRRTLEAIEGLLEKHGFAWKLVYDFRGQRPERYDLLMTVGGDGTVLFASHHVAGVPIFGVNSSPSTSAGYLTSATRATLEPKLRLLRRGTIEVMRLHRLAVDVDGVRVHDRVLNDVLFTSSCPAVTARYVLRAGGRAEEQMSSGLWIGPAAGSTAAQLSAGGRILPPGSKRMQFVVREPVERKGRRCLMRRGVVGPRSTIAILNRWQPSEIYIDGPAMHLGIEPGRTVTVRSSGTPLTLLGWR